MITLELQERFSELSRTDHLHRMQALLTSLDAEQLYSRKPEFAEALSATVALLALNGVTDAYLQGCALLCIFAGQVQMQKNLGEQQPQEQVLRYMQQALAAGVPKGAFNSLFESLAGVGQFDQPWPSGQVQINLMDLLAAVHMNNQPLKLQCNPTGLLAGGAALAVADDLVNMFRTDSGFIHQVFGHFTPEFLIAQVCKNALPANAFQISVDPVFQCCEIGRQHVSGFFPLQRIELIDSRLAKLELKQYSLSCSADEKKHFQSGWLESELLSEPVAQLATPWISTDLNFVAQWASQQDSPGFITNVDMRLHAASDSLKWHASLIHHGVPVSLSIQPQQDIQIHWLHRDIKKPGELTLGEPLWLIQHKVPLHIQANSIIGAGKPVIRAVNPCVGDLVFSLSAVVDPLDRILRIVLTVDHSELLCHWQSIDPVKGWASGHWQLAPAMNILQRNLHHG